MPRRLAGLIAGRNLLDAILRARGNAARIGLEVGLQRVQIHVAAQLVGAEVEHAEVVAPAGQEGVHRHPVAGGLVHRHAVDLHRTVAHILPAQRARFGHEGVLVGRLPVIG